MRFGVLGPLAVRSDDGAAVAVPGALVRALLADLLAHRGTVLGADRLIEDLWGDDPPGHPTATLQSKVSQLRRALDAGEPGARALVASRGAGYVLDAEADAVDAGRFLAATTAPPGETPESAVERLSAALDLWRGEPYADVADAEFARAAVTTLAQQRLHALEARLAARLALGQVDAVVAEAGALADRHPLRERLHALLMRALYRAGRQAEALEGFERVRTRLRDELGVDPSPELADLHAAVLRQDPALDGPPAPAAPAPAAPAPAAPAPPPGSSTLPAAWDETVGREADVASLRAVLDRARLVTLTGPGGVGKTRLATETARTLVAERAGGVRIVDLTVVTRQGADRVGEVVAAALGLRDDGVDADDPDRLAAAVGDRELLVLLDNCEHVVERVADLVSALLRRAPRVQVLATSREPLGVRGEHLYPVETLAPPEPGADPASSPAVRLFVARAAAATGGFDLDERTAGLVADLSRRLDGLPLALELAAARVRTLGLGALAAGLDDRFRLLADGPRDAPARQRTLRAVIDWSWEPLSRAERAVLRRLAVTVDGCGPELAEAVCGGDPVPAGEVMTLIARLVDRSLVVADGSHGHPRYRLLETVSAYARERLDEAGETDRVRDRHAAGVAALVEPLGRELRGPRQGDALARLDVEAANLDAALDTAVARGDAALALRLVDSSVWYWFLRGRLRLARRSVARALAVAPSPSAPELASRRDGAGLVLAALRITTRDVPDPDAHARTALEEHGGVVESGDGGARSGWLLGHALSGVGGMEAPERLLARTLAVFRGTDDRWGVAAALIGTGWLALVRGRLDEARRAGAEAADIADGIGDAWCGARAALLQATLDEIAADYASAQRCLLDCARLADGLCLEPIAVEALNRLGRLAALVGDHGLADARHEQALRRAEEQGDLAAATFARFGLGMVARRTGRLDAAAGHLHEALERTGEYEAGQAAALVELGFLAEQQGRLPEARDHHGAALASARRAGDPRAVAFALEGLAGVAVAAGSAVAAAELLGAATAARDGTGAPRPVAERFDVDRIDAAIRRRLDDGSYDTAFGRGRASDPSRPGSLPDLDRVTGE